MNTKISCVLFAIVVTFYSLEAQNRSQELYLLPYHQQIQKMPSVSFELGETKEIPTPFPDNFISLTIPAHNGLPRIGYLKRFEETKRTDIYEYNETANDRRSVKEWQTQNLGIYISLLVLDIMKADVVMEDMLNNFVFKDNFTKYKAHSHQFGPGYVNFYPRGHIEGLASGILTPEKFKTYYCSEEADYCQPEALKRNGRLWGGNKNEFSARRAYTTFLQDEVPKLKQWAASLSKDFYVVMATSLSSYDFTKGGYRVDLLFPRAISQESGTTLLYWPQNEESAILDPGVPHSLFLTMSDVEAEKIDTRLTEMGQTSYKQLFAVVKGTIYGITREGRNSGSAMIYGGRSGLLFDIRAPEITFYLDEDLQEKVYESTLKPKP